jgi:putative flavoprotein involved in K+ transport
VTAGEVNVAIIGGGQAGLSTSYYLTQSGDDHVVLEAGRIAETWRSRRWDSFCLVTPNWTVQLPGGQYDGPDPDGFMVRDRLVEHFERWVASFHAPVEHGRQVTVLEQDGDVFVLSTAQGAVRARSVVIATGGYQRAYRPPNADQIPTSVTQRLAEEYGNPSKIPPGAVVVIGSGQTGCQIAEELNAAGRKVFLACGRAVWAPRRMGGHDLVWWLVESGFVDRTIAQLPSPAARLWSNPQATGRDGGHDLNYRTLHASGVELLGRFAGAEDGKIHFANDLAESIQAGDDLARAFLRSWVAPMCDRRGLSLPWEVPGPPGYIARNELDVEKDGISTVIWTAGYRPDYGWVHVPVFDDMGFPIQVDGRSAVPGLYFMGVHFQRKARSAVLYGVAEDAEIVAGHIAENRR